MTNYSDNPGKVRADFFKPSGKWYMSVALDMSAVYTHPDGTKAAVQAALEDAGYTTPGNLTVVVLEPYHEFVYPIMIPARTEN